MHTTQYTDPAVCRYLENSAFLGVSPGEHNYSVPENSNGWLDPSNQSTIVAFQCGKLEVRMYFHCFVFKKITRDSDDTLIGGAPPYKSHSDNTLIGGAPPLNPTFAILMTHNNEQGTLFKGWMTIVVETSGLVEPLNNTQLQFHNYPGTEYNNGTYVF